MNDRPIKNKLKKWFNSLFCNHQWSSNGSDSYNNGLEKGEVVKYNCSKCKKIKYKQVINPFSSNIGCDR